MSLEDTRKRIDEIDKQMLELFCERMRCAEEIAREKKTCGKAVADSDREREILEKVSVSAGEELGEYARTVWQTLMDVSKKYQSGLMEKAPEAGE